MILGSFKNWEGWREAHNIKVETLLLNRKYDETTDLYMESWQREIKNVKWVTLKTFSHTGLYEDREGFMQACVLFLTGAGP